MAALLLLAGCTAASQSLRESPTATAARPSVGSTPPQATVAASPPASSASAAASAPLIPLLDFGLPSDAPLSYRLSPDGTRLAWTKGGDIHVEVLATGAQGVVRTGASGVGWLVWTQDNRRILYLQETGGDERTRVHCVAVDPPAESVDITPPDSSHAWVHQTLRSDPSQVLVAARHGVGGPVDLYRVNLTTFERTRLGHNPGNVVAWFTDLDGGIVARVRRAGATELLEVRRGESWTELWRFAPEYQPRWLGTTPDGRSIWLLTNHGRDRVALLRLDLTTGAETVVYQHDRVDVEDAAIDQFTGAPWLAVAHPDRPVVEFFDPALARDLAGVRPSGPSGVAILSASDDGQRLVVDVWTDRRHAQYLIDRATGKARLLGDLSQRVPESALVPVEPVSFASRDGLVLRGYLARPAGAAGPSPLVLLVHGGHANRDHWGYSTGVQFLANRGYAVLQVNYRGSTGYGRAFRELAVGEYARKMHADLIDGVRWAIAERIADPEQVAIVGGSYGGYAALVGMTLTPELFRCGVAVAPITDLPSFIEQVPPPWKPYWYKYVGDPNRPDDARRLQERSPLTFADRVRRPILIMHGVNDSRVRIEQSERMVDALRRAGKDVRYSSLPDEGHQLQKDRSVARLRVGLEDFLGSCLGGRVATVAAADDYDGLVEAAKSLTRAGRADAALARATAAAALAPDQFEAYVAAALAASWSDAAERTPELLRAAIERAPFGSERDTLYAHARALDRAWVDAEFQRRLAAASAARESGDRRRAALAYLESIRLRPDAGAVGLEAVSLFIEIGDHDLPLAILAHTDRSLEADVAQTSKEWRRRLEALRAPLLAAQALYDRREFTAAATMLQQVAQQPSSGAMYGLGILYQAGNGVDKDEAESARWYRKAADAGHRGALNALGIMHEEGRGVPKDEAEAARLYRQAAEMGDADAMNNLGLLYETGRGGLARSESQAARWYRSATAAGNAVAKTNLGWLHANGRGVAKDDAKAVVLLREAAEANNTRAMTLLAWMYREGRGVDRDDTEAVRWYEKAAAAGDLGGQVGLGWMYAEGRGVTRDEMRADALFREAVKANHAPAMAALGWRYEHGRGASRDAAEAARWYRRAADQGHARSMYDLARLYEAGLGVDKNEEEAVRWYRRAASLGYGPAVGQLRVLGRDP